MFTQLEPSYSKSVEDLFLDVACLYVDCYEVANLLNQAEGWEPGEDRPSWVPDWRVREVPEVLPASYWTGLDQTHDISNYAVAAEVERSAKVLKVA